MCQRLTPTCRTGPAPSILPVLHLETPKLPALDLKGGTRLGRRRATGSAPGAGRRFWTFEANFERTNPIWRRAAGGVRLEPDAGFGRSKPVLNERTQFGGGPPESAPGAGLAVLTFEANFERTNPIWRRAAGECA